MCTGAAPEEEAEIDELLDAVVTSARRKGAQLPFAANTAYVNTIRPEGQPPHPGDRRLEQTIRRYIRWNAVAMVLRIASHLLPKGMSVIESHQTLAVSSMQGERIIQSVRFLRRWRNPRDHEPDRVPALWVYHKREAVEVEQRVESRIVHLHDV